MANPPDTKQLSAMSAARGLACAEALFAAPRGAPEVAHLRQEAAEYFTIALALQKVNII